VFDKSSPVDSISSIIVGKADFCVLLDPLVRLIKRKTPHSRRALEPEVNLLVLNEGVDEEGLHDAVDPQQVEIVGVLIETLPRAPRTIWRHVVTLAPFNQCEGDQDGKGVVQVRLLVGCVACLDWGPIIQGGQTYIVLD
jgi:hypothetical protein